MSEAVGSSSTGSGAERVYATLRQPIPRLEFEPGAKLDEALLSQRFGVSRTPIREALIRKAW